MKQTLYFGDLHFHTHYSDNRDQATIEEMILAGARYHLSIFGTADHSHNLDAEKWRRTQAETALLREKYPDLVLFNNCEITFLLGHFNVLVPEYIEGTIAEGYHYLYHDPHALKIINHPFPTNDEWHTHIIPDAVGVEVINGAVFTHAKEQGYAIHSALDIPSVHTFATYLALNLPVAAIGASDAHCKAELGYGMTGFWLDGKPDTQAVIKAIREYRTFATTRNGIVIDWSFDAGVNDAGVITWQIDWNTEDSAFNDGVTVEIYRGDQKVYTAAERDGRLHVEHAGLYWITVFDAHDIAVSSPMKVGNTKAVEEDRTNILNTAIHYIRQDLTWLNPDTYSRSQSISPAFNREVAISIISSVDAPHIVDRYGKTVPYDVIRQIPPRVIIDRECDARGFDEFYIWLTRNELHEYVFADIEYRKVGQTFFFKGRLLPGKMAYGEQIGARYRDDREKIWGLLDEQMHCNVHVETLPALIVKIQLDSTRFPYNIREGINSEFVYVEEDVACPVHILDRIKRLCPAWTDGDETRRPFQERIYQLFACGEDEYGTL